MSAADRLPGIGLVAVAIACAWGGARAASTVEPDVPYVVTPPAVVDAMLSLARIGPEDFLIDLGSGDGRIVIAAAKRYGARGLGVDIDGDLVGAARREAQRQGVAGRVTFVEENLFVTDLGRASVVTMYLYPRVLAELRPRLLAELKPGTRIVSHDFDMNGWKPDARVTVAVPGKPYGPPRSEVYLWVVPANAAGTWQWRGGAGAENVEYELSLAQTFQSLEGQAAVGGKPARFEGGRLRGAEIRFTLDADAGGGARRQAFSGRVESRQNSCSVAPADWVAVIR